jgi:putative nucleotidyltransferase with HDIG domain
MITRDQALELLTTHIQNQNLVRHCLAVGATMKALAQKLDGDPEMWEIMGLIHDADWEKTKDTPEKHTLLTLDWVEDERFTHALKSHNRKHTNLAELEGTMEWALECCDELTGFIVACTLILPSKKIADLQVESVLKKFGQKAFAAAVDRAQIAQCEERLGIKLEDFVKFTLNAMQGVSKEIGL